MLDIIPDAIWIVMAGAQRPPTALSRSMVVGAAVMSMSATKAALHRPDPHHLEPRLTLTVLEVMAPRHDTLKRL
jgi:hypothetical protein